MTQSNCIMQIGDYITKDTLNKLSQDQYKDFRKYLQSCGYRVHNLYGEYGYAKCNPSSGVYLDRSTDLYIFDDPSKHDIKNEITLNQIFGAIMDKLSDGIYDSRQEKLDSIDSAISLHQAALAELQQQRDEIKVRRTGRTLGIAFATLGRALTNPNTNIPVIDHVNTHQANLILVEYIETLIGKLGLKNIHVNKTKRVIRYVLSK